ncbi:MAG: hypothetical protein J0M12_11570 [Deltaproteobacteria bacterium]|nr:hypothetical protein [Deltaproteobacteria bacterium]
MNVQFQRDAHETALLPTAPRSRTPIAAALAAFAIVFVLNAYVCDDAFMIFRSVDNFLSGEGLTWNPGERVQVFTGPLYVLPLTLVYLPFWIFSQPLDPTGIYLAALLVNFISSALGVWVFARFCSGWRELCFGLLLLFSSQAFAPFTSSGLETPLTLALVILFFCLWFSPRSETKDRHPLRLFMIASICVLNRLDSALLFIPALCLESFWVWKNLGPRALLRICTLAALPILGWIVFSIVYYGAPFPTSYYAKVGFGMDDSLLWRSGLSYLALSWETDPVTLLTVVLAGLFSVTLLVSNCRETRNQKLAVAWLGAMLGVVYVTKIGGDFIGFRFLAAPFVISALVILASLRTIGPRLAALTHAGAGVALLLYVSVWPSSPLRTPIDLPATFDVKYYYTPSSLLSYSFGKRFPFAAFHSVRSAKHCARLPLKAAQVLKMEGGLRGFCSGPQARTIDPLSITDPLIARLPAPSDLQTFLPGHVVKPVPSGYAESLRFNENRISDPQLREFYAVLHSAITGPLFTWERWKAIWRLNVDYGGRYRNPYLPTVAPLPADNR